MRETTPANGGVAQVEAGEGSQEVRRLAIERFLLTDSEAVPPIETLERMRLEGHAYRSIRNSHPMWSILRDRARAITLRHVAVRLVVARLVRAWRDEGIESMLFKGFYLAEFVYDAPAVRPYGDVDLLIRTEQAAHASRIARRLGLKESWSVLQDATMFDQDSQNRPADYNGHELMNLDDPVTGIRIDVHRRLVHNELPVTRVQERITRNAWDASREVEWEGTRIRVPAPEDAVILGLALQRAWGRDEWYVKPSDFLDFDAIVDRHGITKAGLARRARELGAATTFRLFLERCDPIGLRLDLTPPSWWDRLKWGAIVMPERGHPGLELALVRLLDLPSRALDVLRAIPSVFRAWHRVYGRGVDAVRSELWRDDSHVGRAILTHREWSRLQRGVKRALVLSQRFEGPSDPQFVLALVLELRARGVDARFASGDPNSSVDGHGRCWIEVDGRRVPIVGTDKTLERGAQSSKP